MLSVRDMAGVAAGKLAYKLARRRGSSGSVMPGHVAQKISPHLLETLAQDVEVYLVTGTNGKGSTIAFLSVADNLGQERCICNVLHSNMLNGMVTSFVMESGAFEKSPKKIAFLECDVSSPAGSRTYRVAYGQSAVLHNVLAAHVLWRVVGGDPDELAMGIVAHSLKEARRHTTVVRGCTVHREMVKNAIGANVAIDRFVDFYVESGKAESLADGDTLQVLMDVVSVMVSLHTLDLPSGMLGVDVQPRNHLAQHIGSDHTGTGAIPEAIGAEQAILEQAVLVSGHADFAQVTQILLVEVLQQATRHAKPAPGLFQGRNERLDGVIGLIEVVGIGPHQIVALDEFQSVVDGDRLALVFLIDVVQDVAPLGKPRNVVLDDLLGVVGAAVVDDVHLDSGIGLLEHRIQQPVNIFPAIIGRGYYAD